MLAGAIFWLLHLLLVHGFVASVATEARKLFEIACSMDSNKDSFPLDDTADLRLADEIVDDSSTPSDTAARLQECFPQLTDLEAADLARQEPGSTSEVDEKLFENSVIVDLVDNILKHVQLPEWWSKFFATYSRLFDAVLNICFHEDIHPQMSKITLALLRSTTRSDNLRKQFRMLCALQVVPAFQRFLASEGFSSESAFVKALNELKQDDNVTTISARPGVYMLVLGALDEERADALTKYMGQAVDQAQRILKQHKPRINAMQDDLVDGDDGYDELQTRKRKYASQQYVYQLAERFSDWTPLCVTDHSSLEDHSVLLAITLALNETIFALHGDCISPSKPRKSKLAGAEESSNAAYLRKTNAASYQFVGMFKQAYPELVPSKSFQVPTMRNVPIFERLRFDVWTKKEMSALAAAVEAFKNGSVTEEDFYPFVHASLKHPRSHGGVFQKVLSSHGLRIYNNAWSEEDDEILHREYHNAFQVSGGLSPDKPRFYERIKSHPTMKVCRNTADISDRLRYWGFLGDLELAWLDTTDHRHVQYPCHELYRRVREQTDSDQGDKYVSPVEDIYAALQGVFMIAYSSLSATERDRTLPSLMANFSATIKAMDPENHIGDYRLKTIIEEYASNRKIKLSKLKINRNHDGNLWTKQALEIALACLQDDQQIVKNKTSILEGIRNALLPVWPSAPSTSTIERFFTIAIAKPGAFKVRRGRVSESTESWTPEEFETFTAPWVAGLPALISSAETTENVYLSKGELRPENAGDKREWAPSERQVAAYAFFEHVV